MTLYYCVIYATLAVGLCQETGSSYSISSFDDATIISPLDIANESVAMEFLEKYNDEVRKYYGDYSGRLFAYYTDFTEENVMLLGVAYTALTQYLAGVVNEASMFDVENFSYETKRRIAALLKPTVGGSSSAMVNRYSQATACLSRENCFNLNPDLTRIMAQSRDYNELYWAWDSWREATGQPSRSDFIDGVTQMNRYAYAGGFADTGEHWRSLYEIDDIEEQVYKMYSRCAPLYTQLHAYVRRKLYDFYGPEYINLKGPIPAHLLGNMWAQSWVNIFDVVKPYPRNMTFDLKVALRKKYYTGEQFYRTAEDFFESLGMMKAPESFWKESLLERPQDGRSVVCHGTAWDFRNQKDFRISMCTDITLVDFIIAHHEMGHIQYFMQYVNQPIGFRAGANPGFHEAVGDVIALSAATPTHHRVIGLIDEIEDDEEADINFLLRQGLQKIAMLPFTVLVDTWRWGVFNGSIPTDNLNTKWWEFREKYQGVIPPTPRTEEHFDPASKYHISASVPYIRYFVSYIIQFQFHQALCNAAGHVGPLFKCDIYNSKEAGKLFSDMLKMGSSQHWKDAMKTITGQTEMKVDAFLEYFKPLSDWLEKQNENETLGWDQADGWYPKEPEPWYGRASFMQCSIVVLVLSVFTHLMFT